MIAHSQPTPLDTWRKLARCFYSIRILVDDGRLPWDFQPWHLVRLVEDGPATPTHRSLCRFLLHIWNLKNGRFDLSDTFGWDEDQLAVLAVWATGAVTGQPGHCFS
ncbi:MAG: hypothetical protein HY319_25585 [Armatimonadetes bacterium]|nr:hypothetical protein [Armatimonadota bacterium]